jgi:putative ABC transport system permease protein
MQRMSVALRLARRDLRGALGGFWILVAGIALGVGAIAAVGSIAGAALQAMQGEARLAVGGDVSLRLFHAPARPAQRAYLEASGTYSETAELRPLARPADGTGRGRPVLVELKSVDAAYPLYGSIGLEPALPLDRALEHRNGSWGAAVDRALLDAMDIGIGGRIRLGEVEVVVRAVILAEPERSLRTFALGPRVMIAHGALEASRLAPPGAQVYWYSRVRLAPGTDAAAWIAETEQRFPDAGWRIVDAGDGVPGTERVARISKAVLVLVGASVLLIGGVGVAQAVAGHLDRKIRTIAILRSLGASTRLLFSLYLAQVMAVAALGVAIGLALGISALLGARAFGPGWLRLAEAPVLQPGALLLAAGCGLLAAAVFALWPLGRAGRLSPQELFRDDAAAPRRPACPPPRVIAAMLAGIALLAALLLAGTGMPVLTTAFSIAAGTAALVFLALGKAVGLLAGRLRGMGPPLLRLALGNLSRPGSATAPMVMALGLSLTLLVAVKTVEGNARAHLAGTVPVRAPDLVFIGIPPQDGGAVEAAVAGVPGVEGIRRIPFLHARLTHIDGEPVHRLRIPADIGWAVRGDRGLSWAARPPAGTRIVEGEWWPAGHAGPPRASLDAEVARRLGVGIGSRLTLNLLGAPIEAEVANLRAVDWTVLDLDVPILLSPLPGPPPHSEVLAMKAPPEVLAEVEDAVRTRFPEVPGLRVAPVLAGISDMVEGAARALSAASAATILAALVVLAGSAAAGYRRRLREMVLLKALGASPRQLALACALEFALLGLSAAVLAGALGTAAGYAVVRRVSLEGWTFLPSVPLLLCASAVAAMAVMGLLLALRPLAGRPAGILNADR